MKDRSFQGYFRQVWLDAFKIAVVVGSFLCLINQYECLLNWDFSLGVLMKLIMNFLTPFSVSVYSKIQFLKQSDKQQIK